MPFSLANAFIRLISASLSETNLLMAITGYGTSQLDIHKAMKLDYWALVVQLINTKFN